MRKLRQKWLTGCMAVTFTLAPIVSLPIEALAVQSIASAKVATFAPTVQRLAGTDRYQTAARVAQEGWTTSSNYAVLTAGMDENLVDALAAAPLAKLKNAPILLTEGYKLNPNAEAEIKRLGVTTVYVTTGPNVIKKAVTDRLTELGVTVKVMGGSDRFVTAINIAKEIASVKPFTQIAVTTAWKNADALSVASFAAAKGFPILLTDVNALSQGTADYINSLKEDISDTYVLGSTVVISQAVEYSLPKPKRVGGPDRYATNREILKTFASDIVHGKIFVASGEDNHLVDALSASPLAAQSLAPVVLTGQTMPVETTNFAKDNLLPNQIIALGSESVVPSQSLQGMTTLITYADNGVTRGSTDPAAPETIANTLKISGNNVTLQNAKLDYSIYVQGDKVTLKNLEVTGTVFLDPGPTGTSELDNVNAARIVVLSGAKDSHHLKNVKTAALKIDSESRVETSGATTVVNTSVSAAAILDNVAGSFGKVEVNKGNKGIDTNKNIEFRGVFDQPITVKAPATIKAAEKSSIAKVEIATQYKDDTVTLQGNYNAVEVTKEGNLDISANSKINAQIKVDMPANIKADPTSSVAKVQISTTRQDANVKIEGTSINVVSVESKARIVLPDGTSIKVVIASVGVTVDAGKTAQVTVDSKSYSVQKTGEGQSTIANADLSKIVIAIEKTISDNNIILQGQITIAEATVKAAQDKLTAEIATSTAKTDTERAAAAALEQKATESAATAQTVVAQTNTVIANATENLAASTKELVEAVVAVVAVTGQTGGTGTGTGTGTGDGGNNPTTAIGDINAGEAVSSGTITNGRINRSGSTVTISGTTTLKEVSIKVIGPNGPMYASVVVVNNNTFSDTFTMPSGTSGSLTVVVGQQGTLVGTGTISAQ